MDSDFIKTADQQLTIKSKYSGSVEATARKVYRISPLLLSALFMGNNQRFNSIITVIAVELENSLLNAPSKLSTFQVCLWDVMLFPLHCQLTAIL